MSLWWSNGKDDFVFWRSSQSGGRATYRHRKGKRTDGHYGDVFCAAEAGRPFTQLITPEIKRGYNEVTVSDLMDFDGVVSDTARPRAQSFIGQALAAAGRAGTPFWWVIHKRDSRRSLLWMPYELWFDLLELGVRVSGLDRFRITTEDYGSLIVTPLAEFLEAAKPRYFRTLLGDQ